MVAPCSLFKPKPVGSDEELTYEILPDSLTAFLTKISVMFWFTQLP